jgi:uncharacterized membrane-anchored protein
LTLPPFVLRAADPTPPATPSPAPAATTAPAAPRTLAERLADKGVKTTAGPAKVTLGTVAHYELGEGQVFVGPDSLDKFYQLTHNTRAGNEVGVVLGPGWSLFFDYDSVGYVKDDEKDKLDATKLLASIRERQTADNQARKEKGWDEMQIQGWAAPPHYDEKTHNLKWAMTLASSADNYKETWINENIRLLGRAGIMNVTLVCNVDNFPPAMAQTDRLLAANFGYIQGQRYAEWKKGDKIAAYGLSALVLGGGAAVAAKMGLLGKLGGLFAKFAKLVIAGLVALGAAVAKLWRRITGSHPTDEPR